MADFRFDTNHIRWREFDEDSELSYKLRYGYSILGHDREAGSLDMLMRFGGDGGHCQFHRHVAVTSTLVLEGEQHLEVFQEDGSTQHKVRRAGEYDLSLGNDPPHMERGGVDGAIILLSTHTRDGRLYDLLDEDRNVILEVTIDLLVADFEGNPG